MMTIRMVADVLAGTYGVNAELENVELDTGDTVPPNVSTIVDESRSGAAARRLIIRDETGEEFPPTEELVLPALYVLQGEDMEIPLEKTQAQADAIVSVLISYTGKDGETEIGKEDAWYTMEAVNRTLSQFFENAKVADRTRANIRIENVEGRVLSQAEAQSGDNYIGVGMTLTLRVNDLTPA